MFDAKKILDALIGASAIDPRSQGGQPGAGAGSATGGGAGPGGFGGLGDLLGQVLGGGQQGGAGQSGAGQSGGGGLGGGLGDLLGGILGGGRGGAPAPGEAGGAGVGPRGGAESGAGNSLQDALTRMAGPQAGGLLKQAMDFAKTPQGAAVLAGLAGLMLNKTGSRVSGSAAKLGGAALVGGLAYKAMQEWQRGAAPAETQASVPAPAPGGSAFAADQQSNEESLALVQAMIAAAAADGQVDAAERTRITGALGSVLPQEEAQFLDAAFANPLTAAQLADLATGPEHAAQIYEAARIAIDPDTPAEQAFLRDLRQGLGLEDGLVAHLDAAALSARA